MFQCVSSHNISYVTKIGVNLTWKKISWNKKFESRVKGARMHNSRCRKYQHDPWVRQEPRCKLEGFPGVGFWNLCERLTSTLCVSGTIPNNAAVCNILLFSDVYEASRLRNVQRHPDLEGSADGLDPEEMPLKIETRDTTALLFRRTTIHLRVFPFHAVCSYLRWNILLVFLPWLVIRVILVSQST